MFTAKVGWLTVVTATVGWLVDSATVVPVVVIDFDLHFTQHTIMIMHTTGRAMSRNTITTATTTPITTAELVPLLEIDIEVGVEVVVIETEI